MAPTAAPDPEAGRAETRVLGLDLLRCCAIGGVVLSHAVVFLYPYDPGLPAIGGFSFHLYHLGHLGSFGVELFFVLSGFLIGGILLDAGSSLAQPRELMRFYTRRWFRTLPNYFLFLGFNVLLITVVFPQPLPWRTLRYLWFGQTFTTPRTFFFLESWSLCIEEWFYFVYPLLVLVLLRTRRRVGPAFFIVGALLYLGSSFGRFFLACRHPEYTWADDFREIVLVRFDSVMTGVFVSAVAWRWPKIFKAAPAWSALLGGALVLFMYCTCYWYGANNETLFAKTVRFNLISAGFALLLPLAMRVGRSRWTTWSRCIGAVARWSYSMYLVQLPLHRFIRERWFPANQTSPVQGVLAFVTFVGGTLIISAVVFSGFERPVTRLRERFSFSRAAADVGVRSGLVVEQLQLGADGAAEVVS